MSIREVVAHPVTLQFQEIIHLASSSAIRISSEHIEEQHLSGNQKGLSLLVPRHSKRSGPLTNGLLRSRVIRLLVVLGGNILPFFLNVVTIPPSKP